MSNSLFFKSISSSFLVSPRLRHSWGEWFRMKFYVASHIWSYLLESSLWQLSKYNCRHRLFGRPNGKWCITHFQGMTLFSQDVPPVLVVYSLPIYWWWSHILLNGLSLGNFAYDTYQSPLDSEKTHASSDILMTEVHPVSTLTLYFCDIIG